MKDFVSYKKITLQFEMKALQVNAGYKVIFPLII